MSREELAQAASGLRDAIREGRQDHWEQLLAKYKDSLPEIVNDADDGKRTPLLLAVNFGHHEAVEKLLGIKGIDIDAVDSLNRTALTWAVVKGAEKTARLLLDKKACVNHSDKNKKTPLSLLVSSNEIPSSERFNKIMKVLLAREDIDIEHRDENYRTPLLLAAEAGKENAIKFLLKKGAIVDAQDKDGRTPLSWAVSTRHEKNNWLIASLLLEHNANPDCEDNSARTPVSYAISSTIALRLVSRRIHRRLIVCCDGTWNDQEFTQPITNVTRILNCLEAVDERKGRRYEQIPFYIDGIGTGKRVESWRDGMTGEGINLKIREAYRLLCSAYTSDRDQIVLIGFSRGSYTIQCLAKLINDIGFIHKDMVVARLPKIFDAWAHGDGSDPFEGYEPGELDPPELKEEFPEKGKRIDLKKSCQDLLRAGLIQRNINIHAYAAWDTVKALSKEKFSFLNEQLPPNIRSAFHALALDEERIHFLPLTLTSQTSTQLKQCWFRGSHSDIGGGNENTGLADITLCWMISQLEVLVQFDDTACCDAANAGNILKVEMAKKNKDVPEIVDLEIYNSMTKRYKVADFMIGPGVRVVGQNTAQELVHFTVRRLQEIPNQERSRTSQPLVSFRSKILVDSSTDDEEYEWHSLTDKKVVIKEDRPHIYEFAMLEAWIDRDSTFANEFKDLLPPKASVEAGSSSSAARE